MTPDSQPQPISDEDMAKLLTQAAERIEGWMREPDAKLVLALGARLSQAERERDYERRANGIAHLNRLIAERDAALKRAQKAEEKLESRDSVIDEYARDTEAALSQLAEMREALEKIRDGEIAQKRCGDPYSPWVIRTADAALANRLAEEGKTT